MIVDRSLSAPRNQKIFEFCNSLAVEDEKEEEESVPEIYEQKEYDFHFEEVEVPPCLTEPELNSSLQELKSKVSGVLPHWAFYCSDHVFDELFDSKSLYVEHAI